MQRRKPPLPALTVKLSKYNVDDVALGVCKTGAEEAGVTEVRTSLSEKKFKQELLLLVYELNRSGLLAENEKIRPILAQLEKLLLCDLSPSTNDSVKN